MKYDAVVYRTEETLKNNVVDETAETMSKI
jgi:hypothetical protein